MKKLFRSLGLFTALFVCATQAFAFGGAFKAAQTKSAIYHALPKDVTFYGDYSDKVGISGEKYCTKGSPASTFTRTVDATHPATYVDANGVIQMAASNAPRFSNYYDATGFHAKSGYLAEAAGTNVLTYSSIPENAAWTKTTMTADNDDAGSSSPDGVVTAPSLTASAGNGKVTQAYVDGVAGIYTASLYIKRKTGTGVINLRANTGDAYTAITTSVLTTTWTRVTCYEYRRCLYLWMST
jgi:hypothetical protein